MVHVFGRVLRGGRHGECLVKELDSPKGEDSILQASKIVRSSRIQRQMAGGGDEALIKIESYALAPQIKQRTNKGQSPVF